MADEEEVEGEEEAQDGEDAEGEEGEGKKKRRFSGRSLVLFVVLPLLLIGGGGAGAYFGGFIGGSEEEAPKEVVAPPKAFFDMPELIVNLSGRDGARNQFLKLRVSLELMDDEGQDVVKPMLPRIVDMFQVYLRELRPTDLEGSAGMFRLKEELIRRVNLEITPHEISDVLFKQIIVQ